MRRPTLAMFMATEAPTSVGICADDISACAALANILEERLMMDPMQPEEGWAGGFARYLFNVMPSNLSGYVVTPWNVVRIISLDVCGKPVRIRNGFYEFLEFGIGLQPKGCRTQACAPSTMQAYERDTVCTLNDFPGTPSQLRVYYTDPADLGRRIVFQGTDQNGQTVFGTDPDTQQATLGEIAYIKGPFALTVNSFSLLTGIQKVPTLGVVKIYTVDAAGNQTFLTSMDPGETTAQYRRYFINGLPCNCCNTPAGAVQVQAQCKLDFVPVNSPSDYLNIPNLPALIEEAQSYRYSKMDSAKAAQLEAKHHAKAIQLLNGQLDVVNGKINVAVAVPLFGSDKLRPQPI